MRTSRKLYVALTAVLCVCTAASEGWAEAAGWFAVGGGAGRSRDDGGASNAGVLLIETGMGTSPARRLVFGGLVRQMTYMDVGTDFSLLQRTTTPGFSLGTWGAALDLGAYRRFFGTSSRGFQGALSGGGPWGTTLSFVASLGTSQERYFGITFGLDWARFTSHRTSGQGRWPNYRLPVEAERGSVASLQTRP